MDEQKYIILLWLGGAACSRRDYTPIDYLTCVHNDDGSIMEFDTVAEANAYANDSPYCDDMRVISTKVVSA